MNPSLTARLLALSAVTVLAAAPARARDDCEVPASLWQPRTAVLQAANQRGWQVERLKIDDGCYEIRGTDADGRRFKAKLDPQTLEVVKLKRRRDNHDRERKERDRHRHRDGTGQGSGAGPGAAPAPSPMAPGAAVRGQIS